MEKSTHKVEVVEIKGIEPHPEADRMEIVKVWGYTCCVGKGQFNKGDLAAYIPPDSIVPPTEDYAFLNKGDDLSDFPERRRRITAKKLRGIYSQGLLVPAPAGSKEGDNVAEKLNIEHYEPELRSGGGGGGKIISGQQDKAPNGFYPLYDVDAFNRYGDLFKKDEMVVVHEKIHGANGLYTYKDGRFRVRSRKLWKKPSRKDLLETTEGWWNQMKVRFDIFTGRISPSNFEKSDDWWKALKKHPEVQMFLKDNPQYSVYAEVYGRVQSLTYGLPNDVDMVIFDIIEEDRFLNYEETSKLQSLYNLPWAPILYHGPFNENIVRKLAEGDSHLAYKNGVENQIMEGVVIKPEVERTDPKIGRVQLKIVSNRYYEGGK